MNSSDLKKLARSLIVCLAGILGIESIALFLDIPSAHAEMAGKGSKDMSPAPNKEHGPCEGMG